ncbi:NACHT domain-containing protein [Psychrobacter alimentarius]|uniref:NACHT domain-containing protein n=1 Tax=Psychrobacter alimentarius TaxID=261164 RepID=UPI00191B0756|nr:NACHT domain-containing protein [Psychrobacter alimentarius]
MVAEALVLTALKDPVKKLTNWIFGEASGKINEVKMKNALSKLHEKISDVVMVKTFYQINESIDLHKFYVPTRVENVNTIVDSIEKIDSSSIALEGTVGQGKSIFMRYLTYQEANRGVRVPVFFELRRLNEKQTLEDAISTLISNWIPLFTKEHFDKIASSGEVILFLDGFDEIAQEDVSRLINEIEGWQERYPKMQLVISTRPEAEIQKSNPMKVYKLAEYEFHEQKQLIKKLVLDEEFQENLIRNIEKSSLEIKELLKTPLMVTLFVKQYEASLKIPKNQNEFYENLFYNIASLHDNTKAGYIRKLNSSLDISKLQEIFEEFCFITSNEQKLVFSKKETIEKIKKCLNKQNINDNPENVLKDFSTVVCLLLRDGSEYSFIHRSIQEYFYSSFISHKSPEAKKVFYNKVLSDENFFLRMENTISFLESIDSYNYYKDFKIKILNRCIDDYKINYYDNDIYENCYIYLNDNALEVQIILKNFLDYEVMFDSSFFNEFYYAIYNYKKDVYSSPTVQVSSSSQRDYRYISLEEFVDNNLTDLIKEYFIRLGNNVLESKKNITEYLEKRDDIDFDF